MGRYFATVDVEFDADDQEAADRIGLDILSQIESILGAQATIVSLDEMT